MTRTWQPPTPTPLLAYMASERTNYETGADYTLRDEWTVVPLGTTPGVIPIVREYFGEHCFLKQYCLFHRYIRAGIAEPWTPFDQADTLPEIYDMIDPKALAEDPAFAEWQTEDRARKAEAERHAKAQSERDRAAADRKARLAASQKTFDRMYNGKWTDLCNRWNDTIRRLNTPETRDRILHLKSLHDEALFETRIPQKARKMREFLDAADAATEGIDPKGTTMTHYQLLIQTILQDTPLKNVNPRYVEAFMRLDHPTLDHLPEYRFRTLTLECAQDVTSIDPTTAEQIAQAQGV